MKSFFKIFFASLLALFIFCFIGFLIMAGIVGSLMRSEKSEVGSKGILLLDLAQAYKEQSSENLSLNFSGGSSFSKKPGLYDLVQMIHYAKTDSSIKAIYIKCNDNANGFAASEELRQALQDFKESKKPVIAYGETITQKAYYVASAADKIYTHPRGGLDWRGYAATYPFFKGLLDKLEIQPQIFYAGKFKSATEPFRATQMTDANKLQTRVWLGDLYASLLLAAESKSKKFDTAQIHTLANNMTLQTADDAVKYSLIDGVKYDDEIKTELHQIVKSKEKETLNFVKFSDYMQAVNYSNSGKDRIAVIYAEGDIVDGKGEDGQIGSVEFKNLIRQARLNDSIKAIVLRVNSPGGSALASDVIWREISLAKKAKPVIVSMSNYAASGGYYISCAADCIYAEPGTITGSIGVFGMLLNSESFLKNKLGITFDGVKTAEHADMVSPVHKLTPVEQNYFQSGIDSTYFIFKSRVAEGRRKSMEYIDSIAQGRVWTGVRAQGIGLVDSIGSLNDAIKYAAEKIKSKSYRIKEYPQPKSIFDQLF
ncbi:MAG: signal peptide peptidase SppA, partial [Chitinophagaceae bacterium]|nr:signal peptide peptidase SppA [Chitinophagaceae bacterium]